MSISFGTRTPWNTSITKHRQYNLSTPSSKTMGTCHDHTCTINHQRTTHHVLTLSFAPLALLTWISNRLNTHDPAINICRAHSVRYAPWSANSGFYYLRHNDRTQYFLNSLLMAGDLILKTDSHQQALVAVLSEHASLYGLRVKVLSRDEDEFPGGYHFHQKSGKYMRAFLAKEKKPYLFHMSWTTNKDNKLLFFRQMGEWYLNDQCIQKNPSEVTVVDNDFAKTCCSAEALFSCHYRDKPSIKPCKDSPPIDKRGRSFW